MYPNEIFSLYEHSMKRAKRFSPPADLVVNPQQPIDNAKKYHLILLEIMTSTNISIYKVLNSKYDNYQPCQLSFSRHSNGQQVI